MCGKVEVDGEVGDWIEKKIRISGWLGAPILWGPQAAAYLCLYVKTATATGYNSIDLILPANKESQPNSRILTLMHEAAYFYSEFIFYISRICLCRWKSYADRLPARQGSIVMSGPRNRKNMYGRKSIRRNTVYQKHLQIFQYKNIFCSSNRNTCMYFNILQLHYSKHSDDVESEEGFNETGKKPFIWEMYWEIIGLKVSHSVHSISEVFTLLDWHYAVATSLSEIMSTSRTVRLQVLRSRGFALQHNLTTFNSCRMNGVNGDTNNLWSPYSV